MQSQPVRSLAAALALLAAFWLAQANWAHPVLRFTDDYANLIAIWLLMLLPWATVVVAVRGLRRWWRWLTILAALPALCVGSLGFAFVSLEVSSRAIGSPDTSFTPIRRVELPRGGELVLYRSDCGAICGVGVVAWEEHRIAPGVRVVHPLYAGPDDADADEILELLPPDSVRIGDRRLPLRRWIWF